MRLCERRCGCAGEGAGEAVREAAWLCWRRSGLFTQMQRLAQRLVGLTCSGDAGSLDIAVGQGLRERLWCPWAGGLGVMVGEGGRC